VREVRERDGVALRAAGALGVYLWRNPANGRRTLRFAFTVFAVADHDADKNSDSASWARTGCRPWSSRHARRACAAPWWLRCVHDYLSGQRLALEPVAGSDLQAASAASAEAVSL